MVVLYALAFLYNGENILLVRRHINATFGAGLYSLVGGKVEHGETALQAVVREVWEETGIRLEQAAFELVHVLNRKGTEAEFVALCFKADIAGMNPVNAE